jgi:DNA adenine methylase
VAVTASGRSARRYPSPLRYPGGKGKIANFIKLLFLHNGLVGHDYLELYAGGAAVALGLLYEEYASHVHINDLNRGVFNFWKVVLEQPDALCRRIAATRVTMAEWTRQRAVQQARKPDPVDLAFSTFFLNRTNRSGIIDGGVIGGQDQDGAWPLDARYNKQELIRRIEKIGRFRNRITLTGIDAAQYLQRRLPSLRDETFAYLDPPYYEKGADLYEDSYRHEDHAKIAGLMRHVRHPWLVSYDAAPELATLYKGFKRLAYGLSYSAGLRYRGSEIMFFGPDVSRPRGVLPANVHMKVVLRQLSA